jgi:hypothetical protein
VRSASLIVLAACAAAPDRDPRGPTSPPIGPVSVAEPDAAVDEPPDAAIDAAIAVGDEVWLKGNTHVHAKPSGDSTTPIPEVLAYYEQRGYDFIVLTDHNRISEVGPTSTAGSPAVRATGMIVLAGIELTYNPTGCVPAGDDSGRCRIHVNLMGPTARFDGKLEWANRAADERVEKYQAAIDAQKQLGGLIQLNHPNWYWGMTPDVLVEVARRGISLVEIANAQFAKWNAGDKDHPSTEMLWDAVLAKGYAMWGVASDDAHQFNADGSGKYPAGGAWVVVKARRDPRAILDALAKGRFYASTGVVLERAEVENAELVVEVGARELGTHTITFVENGKIVATVTGNRARRAVPATGYVRAVVTRGDGKQAWIQPARRP